MRCEAVGGQVKRVQRFFGVRAGAGEASTRASAAIALTS